MPNIVLRDEVELETLLKFLRKHGGEEFERYDERKEYYNPSSVRVYTDLDWFLYFDVMETDSIHLEGSLYQVDEYLSRSDDNNLQGGELTDYMIANYQ